MKISELIENITATDIKSVEKHLNDVWDEDDLEFNFHTHGKENGNSHFLSRVNDSRNKPPISISDIEDTFTKAHQFNKPKHKLKTMPAGGEVVVTNPENRINIPVIANDKVNPKTGYKEKVITPKTIMRKNDFKTRGDVIEIPKVNKKPEQLLYKGKNDLELDEMALKSYEPIGDFNKSHSFSNKVDRKLAVHPTQLKKIESFLEKTPYDFRIFVLNQQGARKYAEHGSMTYDEFLKAFGRETAANVFSDTDDAINIVYVGNAGADKVMFTPWIMAHRLGHAFQSENRKQRYSTQWSETEKFFFTHINDILRSVYKIDQSSNRNDFDYKLAQYYSALFNSIGTMRSARTNQIKRPYEFLYECFAQYLKTGSVTFNPLKPYIPYGKKAWGRDTTALRGREITDQVNDDLEWFANGLADYFDSVLGSSLGYVFVM